MSNGHGEKPHREGDFEGRTYLYIRTNPADDGTEPLAAGLKQWQSPDVVVIKPGGARGTEAVADQPNDVEVTVTNAGGIDAVNAYVDCFFADPSTAFTPLTATLIGGAHLTIPGYNTTNATFPWTPGSSDAGHRCLVARVALFVPFDAYADGAMFDVRGDRHVAQRNIHIIELGDGTSVRFGFSIVNPFRSPMQMRLLTREVRDALGQQGLGAALGCGLVQFADAPLKVFKLDLGRERHVPRRPDVTQRRPEAPTPRLQGVGLLSPVALRRPRSRLSLKLEAMEVRQGLLYVEPNPDARPGDIHAIDITQTSDRGTAVGGLTVVVRHSAA